MKNNYENLLEKINNGSLKVGVIGLGYVGLPLAVAFARNNISVIGFDLNEDKCRMLEGGRNYIADVNDSELLSVIESGRFRATWIFEDISECDALIICVPTPLDQFKKPDISYIENSARMIARHIKPGTIVSLESTTYPTTTEETIKPILDELSGLKFDDDYWLCYSPERVDPGNTEYKTENTPKVLGGLGERSSELGTLMYKRVIRDVHTVSSPRVAEMVKILENTYRLVNISLINELALLADRMKIDIWEVIDAAKTKPFGFQAFYPGPGIGGHCIPLDPFYLEYIAKKYKFNLTMINTAGQIDDLMPHRMTVKISFSLNKQKKSLNGSKILFLGIAYKPNIADERESPALKIMDEVYHKGAHVEYHDPFISKTVTLQGRSYASVELNTQMLKQYDCVVVTTNHDVFDIEGTVVPNTKLVVDLRNTVVNTYDHVFKI